MYAATLSLFRAASRLLDSLANIESISDAYSQHFDNDLKHSEKSTCQKYNLLLVLITWTSYCQLLHGLPLVIR